MSKLNYGIDLSTELFFSFVSPTIFPARFPYVTYIIITGNMKLVLIHCIILKVINSLSLSVLCFCFSVCLV